MHFRHIVGKAKIHFRFTKFFIFQKKFQIFSYFIDDKTSKKLYGSPTQICFNQGSEVLVFWSYSHFFWEKWSLPLCSLINDFSFHLSLAWQRYQLH